MTRSIYINGNWLPYHTAKIHVEDRAVQFADSVYETIAIQKGRALDVEPHLARLKQSLNKIKIQPPVTWNVLPYLIREAITRNRAREGQIYLQISRGTNKRDHIFPTTPVKASLILFARAIPETIQKKKQQGIHVITYPDQRWLRRDIKSTNLLANVLARQKARELNAQEAWLINEAEIITEGAASNAWIFHHNTLITHPATNQILNGVTRQIILTIAQNILGLAITEQGFSRQQALNCQEAFTSAATSGILPILSLDGKPLAKGKLTQSLQHALEHHAQKQIKSG